MEGLDWELPILLAVMGALPYAAEALINLVSRRNDNRSFGS